MLSHPRRRRRDRLGWRALVRRERQIVFLMVVVTVCLLLFLAIAEIVEQGRANAFDLQVLHTLRPAGPRRDSLLWIWADIGASDLSAMGSISVLAYIVVLVSGLFLGLKRWREAALLFLSSVSGLIMVIAL